jgi:hypothetical protein
VPQNPELVAVYRLPSPVGLTSGCAGKTLPVELGQIRGRMLLPHLNWDGERPRLTTPSITEWATKTVEVEAQTKGGWGGPQLWDPVRNTVQHIYLRAVAIELQAPVGSFSFHHEPGGLGVPDGQAIDELFHSIAGWWARFGEWVELCTNQDMDADSPLHSSTSPGDGLALIGTDGEEISTPRFSNKLVLFTREVNPLTVANIRLIAKLVNQRAEPSDSHELVRLGWSQLRRGHPRRAVIDAGAALELALAAFNQRGPKAKVGSRPTLGGYVNDKKISGAAQLPANTDRDVVKLRNTAIHKNVQPSPEQAELALRTVRSVLDRLDPLPSGPWRPPPVRPRSRGGTV